MRTPEDPCRDSASEARDDHASEPRVTPETDALVPSQGRIRTMREYIDELEAHARRLERQRDGLLAACEWALSELGKHTRPSPIDKAIAAVKGGRDE